MIRPASGNDRQEPEANLRWWAFAYVCGELGPAELERFERLLEGDQEAREAVVEAVRLIELLYRAEADRQVTRLADQTRPPRRWVIAGVLCGMAASLALLLLRPVTPLSGWSSSTWSQPEKVARAWSQLREFDEPGAEGARTSDPDLAWMDSSTEPRLSPRALIEEDEATEASPPGWLLLAAAPVDGPTDVGPERPAP